MEFLNSRIFDAAGFEIEKDVKDVSTGYGEYIFDSFIDETKEISYIYQILKQITENNISYRGYVIPYSSSKQYQDKVKEFCDKFVLLFVNAIDGNFERICIEMGYNEDENIWLTQKMLSSLYDVSITAINQHIKKIY